MEAAKILLKNCKSHTVSIGGVTFKFIEGRGQTISDRGVIEYCQGQSDRFDLIEVKASEPELKTKAPENAVEDESSDEDSLSEPKAPAARGRRKRVKVE